MACLYGIMHTVAQRYDGALDGECTEASDSTSSSGGRSCNWFPDEIHSLAKTLEVTSDEKVIKLLSSNLEMVEMPLEQPVRNLPSPLRVVEELLSMTLTGDVKTSTDCIAARLASVCVAIAQREVLLEDEDAFHEEVELKTSAVELATVLMRSKRFTEASARSFCAALLERSTAHFHCFSSLKSFILTNARRIVKKFPAYAAELESLVRTVSGDQVDAMGSRERCLQPLSACIAALSQATRRANKKDAPKKTQAPGTAASSPTARVQREGNDASSELELETAKARTVYVCGIDTRISEQELLMLASQCGELSKVRLCGDRKNPTVFGFFEYKTVEEARRLVNLDQTKFGLFVLKISFAARSIRDPRGTFLHSYNLKSQPIREGDIPVYQPRSHTATSRCALCQQGVCLLACESQV